MKTYRFNRHDFKISLVPEAFTIAETGTQATALKVELQGGSKPLQGLVAYNLTDFGYTLDDGKFNITNSPRQALMFLCAELSDQETNNPARLTRLEAMRKATLDLYEGLDEGDTR